MFEKMKEIKLNVTLSALITIAVGVCLIVWPQNTLDIFAKIFAGLLVIIGVTGLITKAIEKSYFGIASGVIITILGCFLFFDTGILTKIIPVVIGVWLIIHGVRDFMLAIESKGYERWWTGLIWALISIAFGVLCILNALGIMTLAMIFIGIMLIYDGVTDLIVVRKVNKAHKEAVVDSKITREEDLF